MPRALAVVVVCAIVAAAAHAWTTAWTCDDAFISFRYARNFVDGHGLVFNVGERVEGYTNFSWTMLCAAAMAFGLDPVPFTQVLGVALFVATALLLVVGGARALPIAAIGYVAMPHARLFATCGLETQLFTFLATALALLIAKARTTRGIVAAGVIGAVAAMTRPDGVVLCAGAGIALLVFARRERSWRAPLVFAASALAVYGPYYAWRFAYYGWPFPNTFYAKSAHVPYPSQGLDYVAWFFAYAPALVLAVPAALLALRARGAAARLPIVLVVTSALYLTFVIWVGGDFMFARFCLPVVPLLLLLVERLRLAVPPMAAVAGGVAVVLLLAVPPTKDVLDRAKERGVVQEHEMYTAEYNACMKDAGLRLRDWFRGLSPRVMFGGGYAMLAYYGEFALAIETSTGLTDEHLAHLPLTERGRVGHEKGIGLDPQYLVRRGIQFAFLTGPTPDRIGERRAITFGTFACGGQTPPLTGAILTYHRPMMDELRRRGAVFVDFEQELDRYLATIAERSPAELAADYAAFREYWFLHNDDPAREAEFTRRLTGK